VHHHNATRWSETCRSQLVTWQSESFTRKKEEGHPLTRRQLYKMNIRATDRSVHACVLVVTSLAGGSSRISTYDNGDLRFWASFLSIFLSLRHTKKMLRENAQKNFSVLILNDPPAWCSAPALRDFEVVLYLLVTDSSADILL